MDTYLDNSITFATDIQKQFTLGAKRFDRGVRQAGFWVLHRSACPSVLIELGFISNYAEEMFLASNSGQNEMAESIYKAFAKYKKNHDKKLNYSADDTPVQQNRQEPKPADTVESKAEPPSVPIEIKEDVPVFKIQIKASPVVLKSNHAEFKGLKNVEYFKEGGMYKYTYGAETEYPKITKLKNDISAKFPDAFVIAFVGEKKITVAEALKYKKSKN